MFSNRVFRPAQQLSGHVRRYATEAPKSGGSNTILYGVVGAGALAGGYYYFSKENPAKAAELKQKVVGKASPDAKKAFTGGDQGFISLVLDEVENINHNTKKFRFKLPEEDNVSGLTVTSALITKYKGPEMEKPVIRPYTPTSDADTPGYLELIIKKYPNGQMSQHIHNMTPGQQLQMKGPIPKYPWTENKHDHVALIAGGTGITPMYQLTRQIFKNPNDKTKVTLVFGNVTEEDILLKKELAELENQFPDRFRAFYVLSKPSKDWQQGKGHINKDLLKTVIPGPKEENVKIFVCGPPALYEAISGTKKSPADQGELTGCLKELGYSQDQVYKF
ncbi:NADH-cytochrome b5 reductase [Acrodontium crateriforme]|uniref:NADH-cytochrome b5 reductase n=1 Tax=Acrodontium crateriforme TaxID=150365 RepID=A0AAQ3MA51_9PEZI|nr:NADH-cytochrome b5 reductase [Acrodontium crateriforme]